MLIHGLIDLLCEVVSADQWIGFLAHFWSVGGFLATFLAGTSLPGLL